MEKNRCIPANQFGFRRGRSSMDCVASVVADVLQGFSWAGSGPEGGVQCVVAGRFSPPAI